MLSEKVSGVADAMSVAEARIQTGQKPHWVEDCIFDAEFKGENEMHVTRLLLDRQIHAERKEDFVHEAMRLETMEAIQHLSQWRLQFEPRIQSVVLHFIRIRRRTETFEQLDLAKGHLFQREEGLNRFVIDGWFTYLQVLDDVRPGDILEWAYTTHTTQRVLSESCVAFQYLPEWTSIGKSQFVVCFDRGRPVKWKSSTGLNPVEIESDGVRKWRWCVEKYIGLKREPNAPGWYVSAPWIQISDCPDWQTAAGAIAKVWASRGVEDDALNRLVNEIEKEKATLSERIDKAIQLIQDEHRYLSLNLEFGGQIPAAPETVARRRYGDCKDLSFLLSTLLNRLGATARPVLVNTQFRKSICDVLPTLNVFNHVIVEFEAEGNRRWIDPTIRAQGGGAFNRVVADYGFGLPVDDSASGLVEQPVITRQSSLYELHETIQLDTTGARSLVAMVVRAEGIHADRLRSEFASNGIDEMAKINLRACVNRFGWAERKGDLKFRDDREANLFSMAEVYKINGFLKLHPDRRFCRFPLPSHWITNTLQLPENKDRQTPFALPYPCQIVHIIEVASPTVKPSGTRQMGPRCSLQSTQVQFNRTRKMGFGYWIMNLSVTTSTDFVPSDEIKQHRKFVEKVWAESLWHLDVPVGYSKPRQHKQFGELPSPKLSVAMPAVPKQLDAAKPNMQVVQPTMPVVGRNNPIEQGGKNTQESRVAPKAQKQPAHNSRDKRHSYASKAALSGPQIMLIIIGALVIVFFIFILAVISS